MRNAILMLALFLCLAVEAQSPTAVGSTPGAKFGPKWQSLEGDWAAGTTSGGGGGSCAFHFALGQHVLVRTNHAELAASGSAPAGAHNDLMIISPGATGDQGQASYWDNEGHRIDYTANWSADGNTLTFLSNPGLGPRFRLTYKKTDPDTMTVSFDMALPGNPDAFKQYTSGTIHRATKR